MIENILPSDIQEIFERTKLGKSKFFYIESSEIVKHLSSDRVLIRLRLVENLQYKESNRGPRHRNIVIEVSKCKLRSRKLNELLS